MENFFDYYNSLPDDERNRMRKRLITACMIEPSTWYGWIQKRAIPKPSQKLIAIELGQDMESLFPTEN